MLTELVWDTVKGASQIQAPTDPVSLVQDDDALHLPSSPFLLFPSFFSYPHVDTQCH
jgi:hypothetical protein